ncbi:MAG: hypothetical protein SGARI_002755, partial [Bacillariaceae sp.]
MITKENRDFYHNGSFSLCVGDAAELPTMEGQTNFTGTTKFFFLSCAALHVGLQPLLRMENEFAQRYTKVLQAVESAARQKQSLAPNVLAQMKPIVAAWLGFKAVLEDPELVQLFTKHSLLQLEWVLHVLKTDDPKAVACIPDWMCREPCLWLIFAAQFSWFTLKAEQADKANELATALLQLGTKSDRFSPIVVTALLRIPASSVQAGVARAKEKARQRHRGKHFGKGTNSDDNFVDDNDIDIYSSFDKMDLGVSVFTNARVQTDLLPVLMKTFQSLDAVEGLDVDRHDFEKFSVKLELTELFVRLWSHPDGKCRQSVLNTPPEKIARFASSISAAIGYLLDDACLRMADVCKYSNRLKSEGRSRSDLSFEQKQARAAAGNFASSRKLLQLVSLLSEEPAIAKIMGGSHACSKDLAVMVVHFLDLLTESGGGTHPHLEFERDGSDPTNNLVACECIMSAQEKSVLATAIVQSRHKARSKIGFDASLLSHQLLALAARWHSGAVDSTSSNNESLFLQAMTEHEDCEIQRYRKIQERLLAVPVPALAGTEGDTAK